jgi:hypothetical protein
LLRRFIDAAAEIFFVPSTEVLTQAGRMQATAWGIAGTPISHIAERCSFDALLDGFGLADPALQRLASIVRGADAGTLALAPQSAGLLAIFQGMPHCQGSDAALLAAMLPMYDALYAWCSLQVTSQEASCPRSAL